MRSFFVLRLFPTSFQFVGPYTEEQLCTEMKMGRITLSDLAYCPQDPGKWRRLLKFERLLEFQPEVPGNDELIKFEDEAAGRMKQQAKTSAPKTAGPQIKKAVKERLIEVEPSEAVASYSDSKQKIWYLQCEGAEFGPFTFNEFGRIFNSGKLSGTIYAWKEGLVNWMKVESLEQVVADLPQAERTKGFVIEKGTNKRIHVRAAFVATVSIRFAGENHTGLCLDISDGGLQVGKWGAKVVLNTAHSLTITPLGLTGIAPFSAESTVSWIDEATGSTGFRFDSFKKSSDRKLLMQYLKDSNKGFR